MTEFPYQYDSSFPRDYQESGCYMHVIAKIAYDEGGFSDANIRERIKAVINAAKLSDFVDKDLMVRNPEKIFLLYGLMVKYTDKHEKPDRMCAPDEREILCFARDMPDYRITHFVEGDGEGNVEWDPLKTSITVAKGYLLSKRIFKILGRV